MDIGNLRKVSVIINNIEQIDRDLKSLKGIDSHISSFDLIIKNTVRDGRNTQMPLNKDILNFVINHLEGQRIKLEDELKLL